jgi:hypothetical protein
MVAVETLLEESGESPARVTILDVVIADSMKVRLKCTCVHSVKTASLVRQQSCW